MSISDNTLWTGRIVNVLPTEYRLARLPSGETVLQGRFFWQERGFGGLSGYEWKTLDSAWARELGLHENTVLRVRRYETWAHV